MYYIVWYYIVLCCIVLCCTVLYCIAMYCIGLCCIVLYCITLYLACNVLSRVVWKVSPSSSAKAVGGVVHPFPRRRVRKARAPLLEGRRRDPPPCASKGIVLYSFIFVLVEARGVRHGLHPSTPQHTPARLSITFSHQHAPARPSTLQH